MMRKFGAGARSIVINGAYLMGSSWIEFGLSVVYMVALARYLGPENYGIWAYGAATYILGIGLISFGFDILIPTRLGVEKRGAGDFVGLTLTLRIALLGLAAGGLALYAFLGEADKTSRLILLILVPALVGRGMAMWARICFIAYERVGVYVKIGTAVRAAEVGLGLLILVAGGGLFGIAFLHAACWVIQGVIGLRIVRSRLIPYAPRFDGREAAALLKQGAVLGLAAALMNCLIAGPLILFRHFGNDFAVVGQLAIPLQAMMIVFSSALVYLVAALPVLSRSAQRGDPRVASYGKMTLLMGAAIGIPAGLVGLFLGPTVVNWVLGPDFALAGTLLGPCLFICALMLAPTGYGQLLMVRGHRWHGVFANGAGGIALLIGLPAATALWGVEGAVLAIAIAWFLRAVVMVALGVLLSGRYRQTAM